LRNLERVVVLRRCPSQEEISDITGDVAMLVCVLREPSSPGCRTDQGCFTYFRFALSPPTEYETLLFARACYEMEDKDE
jgi:hypothetical protein